METLFKEIAKYNLSGWMIFILLLIFVVSHFYKKPIESLIMKIRLKNSDRKVKELINHDLFNTLDRVKLEVKNMKYFTHGKYDAVKTKMCYDFAAFKSEVCYQRFEELLDMNLDTMNVDELKSLMLKEMNSMHVDYVEKITTHWLSKGISNEDVAYIVELFEKFRYDVVQSFATRIDAIFSASYHDNNFKRVLACYDMFAMGVDLLPKDMQTTFESLNGKFMDISYK
jgi:hypothetical protein